MKSLYDLQTDITAAWPSLPRSKRAFLDSLCASIAKRRSYPTRRECAIVARTIKHAGRVQSHKADHEARAALATHIGISWADEHYPDDYDQVANLLGFNRFLAGGL